MAKVGTRAAFEAAREKARRAVCGRAPEVPAPMPHRYVFSLEFEATEEDAGCIAQYCRLLPSYEERYFNRRGEI